MILVCGAGGELGGRVARGLRAAGAQVRALVRPGSGAAGLPRLGIELAEGDFRDQDSLRRAVAGVETVVSTVTAIGRALAGDKEADLRRVDLHGYRDLIAAAEAAGVGRFVFVSSAGVRLEPAAGTPFGSAKIATEERLFASGMRAVVVRPDQFQDVWLTPITQFDWAARKVVVFGKGDTPARYVATDDVAELVVRLALAGDPPRTVDLGGPDPLTRKQAVAIFERALGDSIKRRHVPRAALRAGAVGLRRLRPEIASVMGIALGADLHAPAWDDGPLRELGIQPRTVAAYAAETTGQSGG
jgi:uncharacterized protein YbjT (DUF2867 family)